ncbi:cupin domain-containing protein [Muricoccus radiodurans]|uniref:cupin domain-containing protein n=1 Tax=Muricoccus radiodurans TaxID=2231721 RepID=UPI003CF017F8
MPDGTIVKGAGSAKDWRTQGIRHVPAAQKSCDTPETLGMNRQVAISGSRTGSSALWAGTNRIEPSAKTGPHHHGGLESVIYVISGTAHMRWGDKLEFITEAKAGDFFLVPPYVPHQEINPSATEVLHCALVRSGTEEVVVNLTNLVPVPKPEWIQQG